jgi:hypothetical protein
MSPETREKGDEPAKTVRVAAAHEADELLRVTNAAYQVEKFFIDTERLDRERLGALLTKGVFLVTDGMAGCVYVELRRSGLSGALGGPRVRVREPASYWSRQRTMPGLQLRFMDLRIVNLRGLPRSSLSRLCGNGDRAFPG